MGAIRLAWKYILFHKAKTLVMIACIVLTTLLPILIGILLNQFNQKIVSRADSTAAIIGANGSDLDLTLQSLYFHNKTLDSIQFRHVGNIREQDWAVPIPLHVKFTAQGFPIVGTDLKYFRFRGLDVSRGEFLSTLGDCVIGDQVARELGLAPGDRLLSDRENLLDIGGQTPLKLLVRGILKPSHTPDDRAVFVDLKTAWTIEGLGHGHQPLDPQADADKLLGTDGDTIVASAAVVPHLEINASNIGSFHFHGDMENFPISSIIAVSPDEKSETLLQGYYQTREPSAQLARPPLVVRELMSMVFRVKRFFDLNAILIAISTFLLLLLVVFLSMRLRKNEMETMFKLGCNQGMILSLQLAELAFIFSIAAVLVGLASWTAWNFSGRLVESLLVG